MTHYDTLMTHFHKLLFLIYILLYKCIGYLILIKKIVNILVINDSYAGFYKESKRVTMKK